MTDKILPADLENNGAIAELNRRCLERRHQTADSQTHAAALRAAIGMVMHGQLAKRDADAVWLDVTVGLMLRVMTNLNACRCELMGMRGRDTRQRANSTPVENERARKDQNEKAA